MPGSQSTVERYLRRVRRRAGAFYALRGAVAVLGAGLLAFSALSLGVGPVVSLPVAAFAWLLSLLAAGLGAYGALRGVRKLSGNGVTALFREALPAASSTPLAPLASAARSAVELDRDARAQALAPDLIAAHAAQVSRALAVVPVRQVVPLSFVGHPAMVLGTLAIALALLLLLTLDRSAAGAFALTHPGMTDEVGTQVAAVVSRVDARLVFPGYLNLPPASLDDITTLEAPRGTSIELTVTPRIVATGGVLTVGSTSVQLSQTDGEALTARLVLREAGKLTLSLDDATGTRLKDPRRRAVRIIDDLAPEVVLLAPEGDSIVELDDDVPVMWEATDDVGLASVDLVIETPDGREIRRRVHRSEARREANARGGQFIVARAFGAEAGDRLRVWVEARDGDEVSGPKVGKSEVRMVTVASEATRRAAALDDLSAVVGRGLDALADRLETPVPGQGAGPEAALNRYHQVGASHHAFAMALEGLGAALRGQPAQQAAASLYTEMARRARRVIAREARAHGRRPAPVRRRRSLDADAVASLEADCLLLADSLAQAQLEDAAAITRELEALRREIASLLSELRRADSPEARAALLAAVARAQQRMEELAARLATMAEDVPSDFVNADALPSEEAEDALGSLAEAVANGDLDAAEAQLRELERRIDQIAAMLGGGMEGFMEERFGPRDRAMAEALDALAGLEAEQGQLAQSTTDVRRGAADRALRASGGATHEEAARLAESAREVSEALDAVAEGAPGVADGDVLERAQQRVRDVADALETDDFGEARRMANEAALDAEDLRRDLEISALMFPGRDGQTAAAAARARQAAETLDDLRHDIDRAIPEVAEYVDDQGRRKMRDDVSTQAEAISAAEALAETFEEGPDGTPLSPDAARGLREARDAMERGRAGLGRGDPIEASRAQGEAARRLTELREELEQQDQQNSGGGGGSNGGGEASAPDFQESVHIPGAEEFEGPMALRRRLLDAMRHGAPAGYEESVRRYYEELLR